MDLLSNRERQVIVHVTAGASDKVIANELGLSASTVRVLVARAVAKAGVRSRKDLLAKLASSELVDTSAHIGEARPPCGALFAEQVERQHDRGAPDPAPS
jgi:DNA-binding CsgD family transcriptional regulator